VIVPDLEWAAREYIKRLDAADPQANTFFLDETHLGYRTKPRGLAGNAYEVLNTSKHLWMWDATCLSAALQTHGFQRVRRCSFGDCEDAMFESVENCVRFENAVAVEARA
jgi:hypothetical protein